MLQKKYFSVLRASITKVYIFGLKLHNMNEIKHGVQSVLHEIDKEEVIFKNLIEPIKVGHYHSWVINEKNNFDDWTIL